MKPFHAALLFLLVASSCSSVRRDDPEKNVRNFLSAFQSNLSKSDDEILSSFRVRQSKEAVLSVINILQNKDQFIVCEPSIADASITAEDKIVKVVIPTLFRVKELTSNDTANVKLVMSLTPSDGTFLITEFNGEEFYQKFQQIKNNNEREADQKLALNERLWIYENARTLESRFDSVIWYASYRKQNYFYVVNGNWRNYFMAYKTREQKNTGVSMGLVDTKGEIIIPIEYDLVGTIGFDYNDLVEVTKDGKHGYFDIAKKQLVVEPLYDLIVPCNFGRSTAVVKQDTIYGWLDEQYRFNAGFVSNRMQEWFMNMEYLRQPVKLIPGSYSFCEIPSPDYVGNGIIIPPSYFSINGIFEEIENGIMTTTFPINGWTEYKESSGSFLENIGNNIRAVVTTIRERYLEGREEFYTSNNVVFLGDNNETLGSAIISGDGVSMRPIDSTLLEVRTPHDYWFMEEDACEESNLFRHSYFSISPNKEIIELKSVRLYPQTQFVKLDSSYLTGKFVVYDVKTEHQQERTFLSLKTITFMRDEILASYGYKPEGADDNYFAYLRNENTPTFNTVEEAEAQMNEVDKHNFAFLNRVLQLMQPPA